MSEVTWMVKNERTGKFKVLHVNKLLPIKGDPQKVQKEAETPPLSVKRLNPRWKEWA